MPSDESPARSAPSDPDAPEPQATVEVALEPAPGAPDGLATLPIRATRRALRWIRGPAEARRLVLAALVVRLLAAWSSPALPNDGVGLLRASERVLAEGPGALLAVPHHPLPPALFAAAGSVADIQAAATLLVVVASALAVWPFHALARRACGRHAALAASLIYIALPKAVHVGAVPLAEGLVLPFFLGALALAAAARDAGPRMTRRLLWAGLLAALAFLCRPEGLLAFPAALAAAALDGRPGKLRRAALVSVAFLPLALGYVTALSVDRGALSVSPKKDLVRFVGGAAPRVGEPVVAPPVPAPPMETASDPAAVASGVLGALDSALTVPVALLLLVGLLPPRRWRRKRARRPRLLLAGTALLLVLALVRLRTGWGYAGGRHALTAAVLLLPFAGQGLATFGAVLPRVTSQRRFALVGGAILAIPLAARAVLRPPGEGSVDARRLGEAVADASFERGPLRIASSAEPVVAWAAHRVHGAQGGAVDVPLWGRFVRPLEAGAPLDDVADALAGELRDGHVDWVVLDVASARDDGEPGPSRTLAEALQERGVLGRPAIAAGSRLAAFPVIADE